MLIPIGLFHPAREATRLAAEMTFLDLAGLVLAVIVFTGVMILLPRG